MAKSELRPITSLTASLALFISACWGGNAVAIKFTQDALPPIGTAGLRFALGSIFMVLGVYWDRGSISMQRSHWWYAFQVGVLVFLHIGLFHIGLTLTSAAHAAVLVGSHPVFVALFAHFLLPGDQLTFFKVKGLTCATAGLSSVVFAEQLSGTQLTRVDEVTWLGDACIVLSASLLGLRLVYTKHLLDRMEPGVIALWGNLVAMVLFLITSLLWEGPEQFNWNWAAVAGLAYQGFVVAGFCFLTWTILLRRHSASRIAVFSFAQPIFGIIFGNLFRGDPLSSGLVFGAIGVGIGVWLVNRPG